MTFFVAVGAMILVRMFSWRIVSGIVSGMLGDFYHWLEFAVLAGAAYLCLGVMPIVRRELIRVSPAAYGGSGVGVVGGVSSGDGENIGAPPVEEKVALYEVKNEVDE